MLPVQAKSAATFLRLCRRIDLQSAFFHKNFRKGTTESYYDVLGVPNDASEQDIRKAYFELSKKFHPDSNPNDKSLHDKFVKVNDAYRVLSKPSERKLYDDGLKAGFHTGADEVSTTQNWNPNHPQYYYHPKFYKDPKMRKEAAKAWSNQYGDFYFKQYMKDDSEKSRQQDFTPGQRLYARFAAILLPLLFIMIFLQIRKDSKRPREPVNYTGYAKTPVTDTNSSEKTWKVKGVTIPPQEGVTVENIIADRQFNVKESEADKLPTNKF